MRRIVVAVLGTISGLILLFSYHTSTNQGTTGPIASTGHKARPIDTNSTATGSFTGDTASTRWGDVQVKITVEGGQITQADAVKVPDGNFRDAEINNYAVPILNDEVLKSQSASIDAVSGATVTSDGYIQSLQSAIDQASK